MRRPGLRPTAAIVWIAGATLLVSGCDGLPEFEQPAQDATGADRQSDILDQTLSQIEASAWAGIAPFQVSLTALGADTADRESTTYEWSFGDGEKAWGPSVTHNFEDPGLYEIELVVATDAVETTSSDTILVMPPAEIDLLGEFDNGDTQELTLSAQLPTVNSFRLVDFEYHWDFGDGSTGEGEQVTHAFKKAGTYTVVLTLVSASFTVECARRNVDLSGAPGQTDELGDLPSETADAPLMVYPEDSLRIDAIAGDDDIQVKDTFAVVNEGDMPLTWQVSVSANWLEATPLEGSLTPGAEAEVAVQVTEAALDLAPGLHTGLVVFETMDKSARRVRDIELNLADPDGQLAVTPDEPYEPAGNNSVYDPAYKLYTLENTGGEMIDWSAELSAGWLGASPRSGKLAPGATASVKVYVSAGQADNLELGTYSASVRFKNETSGVGDAERNVTLTISDNVMDAAPSGGGGGGGGGGTGDGGGGSPGGDVAVAPDVAPLADSAVDPGQAYSISPSLTAGTTPVSWTLEAGPAGMTIDGSTGAIAWSNPQPANSTHTVTVKAANSAGSDSESWTLAVNAAPDTPPVIAALGDDTTDPGAAYNRAPSLTSGTTPVTWSLTTAPAGMTINTSTGVVSWANPQPANSSHTVTIKATNGVGSDTESWTLRVNASSDVAPVIAALGDDTADPGKPYSRTPSLTQGTTPVTWSLVASPTGMTINSSSGAVSWSNPQTPSSTHTVTIKAQNGVGSDTESWTLAVNASGDVAPIIATLNNDTTSPGSPYSRTPSLTQGTAPVTWSLVASPAGMTISSSTGKVSWSNPQAPNSSHTVTIKAENGEGSDTESWTLAVGSTAQTATSVSQHGITWTFDKAYPVGQFVTGDWWVTPLTPGGSVTVVSVSPAPTTLAWTGSSPNPGNYRVNGSMLNPIFNGGNYANRQSFDERGDYYCETGDGPYDADHKYRVDYPLTIEGDDRLISTDSFGNNENDRTDVYGATASFGRYWIKNAAILTCLDTAPPDDAFRPGYMDSSCTIYRWSDVNKNLLPDYSPVLGNMKFGNITSAVAFKPCTTYARYFERPWLLAWSDTSSMVHPAESMHWYYDLNRDAIADALLLLLCDYSDRDELLQPFLQVCIDQYYCAQRVDKLDRSLCAATWKFAGRLLNNDAMRSFTAETKDETDVYYRSAGESTLTSATVPANETYLEYHGLWTPLNGSEPVAWRGDPGDKEFAHLDPAKMYDVFDIYYDGSAARATIHAFVGNGSGMMLRTYNSSNAVISEHEFGYKFSTDEPDYLAIASAINALDGWHCTAPDVELPENAPFMRTPVSETDCKGAGSAQTVQCSEWDFIPSSGGRKQLTYQGINSPPMPAYALALRAIGAQNDWSNQAFFHYVDMWMNIDPAAYDAFLTAVPGVAAPDTEFGTVHSPFGKAMYDAYGE